VLGVGDRIPEATVFATSREPVPLRELAAERPTVLVFYLFDFSAT
jgi:peroxiredoxin